MESTRKSTRVLFYVAASLLVFYCILLLGRFGLSWNANRLNRQAPQNATHLSPASIDQLSKVVGIALPTQPGTDGVVIFNYGNEMSTIWIRLRYRTTDPKTFLDRIDPLQPPNSETISRERRPKLNFPEKLDWWPQEKIDRYPLIYSGDDQHQYLDIVVDPSADGDIQTYYIEKLVHAEDIPQSLLGDLSRSHLEEAAIIFGDDHGVSRFP